MFKFFTNLFGGDSADDSFNNNSGVDTFINEDGEMHFGMKMGDHMGVDMETGDTYMKMDDHFGMDI